MVTVKRTVEAVLLASFLLLGTYYTTAILDLRETVALNQFGMALLAVVLSLLAIAYFLDQWARKVMESFEGDGVLMTVAIMMVVIVSVVVAELILLFVK